MTRQRKPLLRPFPTPLGFPPRAYQLWEWNPKTETYQWTQTVTKAQLVGKEPRP